MTAPQSKQLHLFQPCAITTCKLHVSGNPKQLKSIPLDDKSHSASLQGLITKANPFPNNNTGSLLFRFQPITITIPLWPKINVNLQCKNNFTHWSINPCWSWCYFPRQGAYKLNQASCPAVKPRQKHTNQFQPGLPHPSTKIRHVLQHVKET